MAEELELNPDQKRAVEAAWHENPDLNDITRKVFANEKIDGRSKEGRAVRDYLVVAGLDYKTTKAVKRDEILLTQAQKELILAQAGDLTPYEIAKQVFPTIEIKGPLQKEVRTILDYIRQEAPENIQKKDSAIGIDYAPPKNFNDAIGKINRATSQEMTNQKLTSQNRANITAYIRYMNYPRIVQTIAGYTNLEDRELFETEFTAKTWDKPDLTADEITLYTGVCEDIVHNKYLTVSRDALNNRLSEALSSDNAKDLSMSLAENLKTVNAEYDNVRKRIESVIKKLNGDRSTRIAKQGERSSNFLALVESFQQEDERKRLLLIAKAHREKVKNEVDRLEGLDEWKARILGVSKQEVL